MNNAKILLLDIETAPLEVYTWGLFDQNISLDMVKEFTSVLSWAAKWYGDPDDKIIYEDQRGKRDIRNDKELLKGIHSLLNQADIVIGQNSKKFDSKKLNGRFAFHKMGPVAPYRQIDTLQEVKKYFALDSNKLAHLSVILCPGNEKDSHHKFPGFSLWRECLNDNIDAWNEMEKYNKQDVISLEGVYNEIKPWIKTVNFNVYNDDTIIKCDCDNSKLHKRGFNFSNTGSYQRYQCKNCKKWWSSKVNMLDKDKRSTILK